jgi:hypothetical protein
LFCCASKLLLNPIANVDSIAQTIKVDNNARWVEIVVGQQRAGIVTVAAKHRPVRTQIFHNEKKIDELENNNSIIAKQKILYNLQLTPH